MNTIQLEVQGMSCGGCIKRVTDTLERLKGVRTVTVDLFSGHVSVSGDLAEGGDELAVVLSAAGYPAKVATAAGATVFTKKSGGCCG